MKYVAVYKPQLLLKNANTVGDKTIVQLSTLITPNIFYCFSSRETFLSLECEQQLCNRLNKCEHLRLFVDGEEKTTLADESFFRFLQFVLL